MTNREGLNKLIELSTQLEKVDYNYIVEILKNHIRKLPVPLGKLSANSEIDRVRKNSGDNLFKSIDELSYIKDQKIIDNYLTEFGRANMPHQPMFYGAIETTKLQHQRITAISETSELFQNVNGVNLRGELYTISRWTNKEELILVEVVFSSKAIQINPDIKKSFELQSEFAKQNGQVDIQFYMDFLVFISDQFARPKTTHNDYKISTAYTNLVMTDPIVQGIAFPSVQTEYVGVNVVFEPKIVDKYLEVRVLSTEKLYKNKTKMFISNFKNCLKPKECYHNLLWEDLDSQYLISNEEIQHYLTSE